MRFFIFIVEAPRILFKDTTSRTDYPIQMRFFIFIVEAQCIVIILIIYCQKRIKYMGSSQNVVRHIPLLYKTFTVSNLKEALP